MINSYNATKATNRENRKLSKYPVLLDLLVSSILEEIAN